MRCTTLHNCPSSPQSHLYRHRHLYPSNRPPHHQLISSSRDNRRNPAATPIPPHTTPKKCPTIGPVESIGGGTVTHPHLSSTEVLLRDVTPWRWHVSVRPPSTEASFRAEFVGGAADKRVKKPRAAFSVQFVNFNCVLTAADDTGCCHLQLEPVYQVHE